MKTIPITSIKNEIIVNKLNYPIPNDKSLPSLFFNLLAIASRGAGKSTSITKLLKAYENSGIVDPITGLTCTQRVFIISPTYQANRHIFSNLHNLDERDVFNDYDDALLKTIIDDIKTEKKHTEEYLEKLMLYNKFKKIKKVQELTMEELIELDMMSYEPPQPPRFAAPTVNFIIVDDMLGSRMYKNGRSYFKTQLIQNRHYWTCFLLCSQSLKGIPKDIRINCNIWLLWKFNNSKINEEIHEELSNKLNMEQFEELYDYATEDDHDYLTIDFSKSKNNGMFNKSYKEILLLE
jgi:hypothetical protein